MRLLCLVLASLVLSLSLGCKGDESPKGGTVSGTSASDKPKGGPPAPPPLPPPPPGKT